MEEEKMNDVEYVLEKLSLFNEIPIVGIGEQNAMVLCNGSLFDAEGFYRENQDLWKQLLGRSEEMEEPVLLVESGIFAYALLKNDDQKGKCLIVWCPRVRCQGRNSGPIGISASTWFPDIRWMA